MKPGETLDEYFVRLANEAKSAKPTRVVRHEKGNKNDKTFKRVTLAIFVIGSLALGFGMAYTNAQNKLIEDRGGTVNYVYNQEKTIVDLNGSEKPTFDEVIDEMLGKGK